MEKKTSTFLVILLCILVFVAGGGASYLYLADAHDQEDQSLNDQIDRLETQVKDLKDQAKKAETTKSTTNTTTTTQTTTDETANWKTYTGEYEGINLKYPSNWKMTLDTKTTKDYQGMNWKGPFDGFTLTGPNNFKIRYTTHVDGIGGGCDVGVNCNKYHWKDVYQMTNANYSNLMLVQYEAREHDDKTVLSRNIALWSPKGSEIKPTTGTTYEGALFTLYDGKGVDTSLSSITGSFDDSTNLSLSTEDFFNLSDVKEAVKIMKTVRFSK